jgi:aspartate aminotransferase
MTELNLSTRVKNIQPSATLGMAQAARKLKDTGVDVITLSAGEPDFRTPMAICDVAKLSIEQGRTHYTPIRGTKNMIEAMQEKFYRDQRVSYNSDEVMCTVGAKSAILLALEAVINEGDEVILFSPFWVSYVEQIRLAGGNPVMINCKSTDNFMPNGKNLAKAITKKTKVIILNSPNNPSGGVISEAQLQEIAEVLKNTGIWLISDEIYEKILFDSNKHFSPANISEDMRNRTIVISGASKGYAMTGWRVGVVAGDQLIISAMSKLQGQNTTCLPEFIQDATAYALRENNVVKNEIERMVNAYKERRELAMQLFLDLSLVKIFKPQGAFYIWADFSHYMGKIIREKLVKDDMDLATRLLKEAHVACVPGTSFGGHGFLRMSIASSKQDIETAFYRIKNWLT